MSTNLESPAVDDFLQDPRFNQTFELPTDPGRNRLSIKVKYADYGYRDEASPAEENVLLFFAPLLASRMLHVAKDALAKRHKVRIVSLDRPGIGGTDEVKLEQRAAICREITLALLKHLGIRHVSLACHSGGTVYAFDMLLHHPEILHPDRPYIAVGAPWILPSRSHLLSMTLTQAIPAPVMGQFDKVVSFVNGTLAPALSSSAGISQTFVGLTRTEQPEAGEANVDARFEETLDPKLFKHIHAESIRGMSSESLFLMQKAQGTPSWGDWADYDSLVPRLTEALEGVGKRLSIDVFFAEADGMIGAADTQGPKWFDECWQAEEARQTISYASTVIGKADHDTVWSIRFGLPERVLEKIGSHS
ncbi:hypothetical protein FZEAL_2756 [Fusarium zealandicum]|uniref:AB hydrolase-1 domain-containing protein n=1 Tax=Fusarium zealandicum TaxID=1053134 RepID=A0A8H4UQW7_9HYPO|nr:hypothetical protein FZEAL_2756 [Fusarium zealandicum]